MPPLEVDGDADAELLVVSWGSTWGAIHTAVHEARRRGRKVAHAHFRYLSPLPANTAEVLAAYPRVLAPELNLGQFAALLRSAFLIDVVSMPKIQGQPFRVSELTDRILDMTESA